MRLISHPAWRHGPSALVCPLVLPRVSLASLKVQWGHPCAVPDEAMLHQWMQWLCGRGPAGILSALQSGTVLGLSVLDVLWNRGCFAPPDPFLLLPNLSSLLQIPPVAHTRAIAHAWILNVRVPLLPLLGTILTTRTIPAMHDLLPPDTRLLHWFPPTRQWVPKDPSWPPTEQPWYWSQAAWIVGVKPSLLASSPPPLPRTRLDTLLPDGRVATRHLMCDVTGDPPYTEWDAGEATWFLLAAWHKGRYMSHEAMQADHPQHPPPSDPGGSTAPPVEVVRAHHRPRP